MSTGAPVLPVGHPAKVSVEFAYNALPGLSTWGDGVVSFGKWKGRKLREALGDTGWCQWVLQKAEQSGFEQEGPRFAVRYLSRVCACTPVALQRAFNEEELRRGIQLSLRVGDPVRARRLIRFGSGDSLTPGTPGTVSTLPDQEGNVEVAFKDFTFDADVRDVEPAGFEGQVISHGELAEFVAQMLRERQQEVALRERLRTVVREGRCRNEQGDVSLKEVRTKLERDFRLCLKTRRNLIRQWVEEADTEGLCGDAGTPQQQVTGQASPGEPPAKYPRRFTAPAARASGPAAPSPSVFYNDAVQFGRVSATGMGYETTTSTTL